MPETYQNTKTVDDWIKASLRKLNGYSDGEEPTVEQMEEARESANDILDVLEAKGVRPYLREWRTRVFEDSDVIDVSSTYYRCILQHTSPNASTWVLSTAYNEDALVFPSVRNGYYYKCTTSGGGTSDGSEPTFPTNQDETVLDNDITWIAIPDSTPGTGKDWAKYWRADSNETSGDTYAQNTDYRRSGDFTLKEDEDSILKAYIRYSGCDTPIQVVGVADYSDINTKYYEGDPESLYMEQQGVGTVIGHLYPSPNLTGATGYILHYQCSLRTKHYTGSVNLDQPDHMFNALVWVLASELGTEYSLDMKTQLYIDSKANEKMKQALKRDMPKSSEKRGIKSCF